MYYKYKSLKYPFKETYRKIFYLIFLFFFIFLVNCKSNDNKILKPEKVPPLNILYSQAFDLYLKGDWSNSIKLFEKVETNYSYSEWAPKATLMIIYMYYEVGDSFQTLKFIQKFKKIYPTNENISYVDFIKALTYYEEIGMPSRDQKYTEIALNEFNKIIKNYPDTNYAYEATLKLDLIKEQLAGKEMYVARYYMAKSKWIPAIKRLKIVISEYDRTVYTNEALHRLVEIYYKLGNINEARKYAAILGYNFNDSDWYKKTYKIIEKKDYFKKKVTDKTKLTEKIRKIFNFSK